MNSLQAGQGGRSDLGDTLRAITADARTQSPMELTLSIFGNPVNLSPEVQDEVVRIAREALTNARKHSYGRKAEVKLEYADAFSLTVSDDGVGFDPSSSSDGLKGHYGLRGMRERAAHIGGKLTISSSAASSTQVKLVLPMRKSRCDADGSSSNIFRTIR